MPQPDVLHRHDLELTPGMLEWLGAEEVCLAVAAGGRLVVVSGPPSIESRSDIALDGIGAVASADDGLWTLDRWQLWRFVDAWAGAHPSGRRLLLPQSAHTIGLIGAADLALTAGGPVMASSLFSCLAVPDEHLSFRPIWAPPWVSALRPESRSGLSGLAARDGLVDTVTLDFRSDEPETDRTLTGTGLVLTTQGEVVLDGLTGPRHPRWWHDTLLVAEAGSGRLLAIDPGRHDAETIVEVPGIAGGLAVAGSHALVGFSVAARSSRADLPGGRLAAGETARDGVALVDLKRGVIVGQARFQGHAGPIFSIGVIPAAVVSIAEPRGVLSQSTVVMADPQPL